MKENLTYFCKLAIVLALLMDALKMLFYFLHLDFKNGKTNNNNRNSTNIHFLWFCFEPEKSKEHTIHVLWTLSSPFITLFITLFFGWLDASFIFISFLFQAIFLFTLPPCAFLTVFICPQADKQSLNIMDHWQLPEICPTSLRLALTREVRISWN